MWVQAVCKVEQGFAGYLSVRAALATEAAVVRNPLLFRVLLVISVIAAKMAPMRLPCLVTGGTSNKPPTSTPRPLPKQQRAHKDNLLQKKGSEVTHEGLRSSRTTAKAEENVTCF